MVTGDPGVGGAHVTQDQAEKIDKGHAIIRCPKMEVPTAQGYLIQVHYVRYTYFKKLFFFLTLNVGCTLQVVSMVTGDPGVFGAHVTQEQG